MAKKAHAPSYQVLDKICITIYKRLKIFEWVKVLSKSSICFCQRTHEKREKRRKSGCPLKLSDSKGGKKKKEKCKKKMKMKRMFN